MVKSPYLVDLPVTSSAEIEHTARRLKAAREEFLTVGTQLKHPPRSLILASWQRCFAMQVDPALRFAPLVITDEVQLRNTRADSRLLMRAARPVMNYLADVLADAGYVIALSNAAGCLLEIIGNAQARRRLSLVDFVPGADWSEAAAGTNALGTAIADGRVVQLLGAEHYCAGWQDITCTAAPIRHPLTGEIMGILDITGDYHLIRPFLSYFVASMALQVQYEVHALLTRPYKRRFWTNSQTLPARSSRRIQSSRSTDLQRFQAYAAHMSTAIGNARHIATSRQHTRRVEVLSTLTQLLSTSPDPCQHLDEILKCIVEIIGMDTGMALLYDQQVDHLMLAAHWGLPANVPPDLCAQPLRSLYEITPRLTTAGKASIYYCGIESAEQDVCALLNNIGCCDMLVAPLPGGTSSLGILLLGSRSHRQLTQEDLTLFTMIGQQLGMTLANFQLRRTSVATTTLGKADLFKNRFFVAVSHDLQSPLAAIRASAESLLHQEETHLSQTQEHLLHTIVGQAGRLDQLVDQLLDLSRIEAGVFSLDQDWLKPHVLITDTAARFAELYSGYQIELDLEANVPLLYVDPDRFVQVLWNLLENARKYVPSQENSAGTDLSCPVIKIDSRWQANEILIGVADRGPGIPTEEHEKIFQHFYRLPRDLRGTTQGSGLGLAICRGIIQAHGGRIWVENRPGGGCIFRFTLPLHTTDLADIAWEM